MFIDYNQGEFFNQWVWFDRLLSYSMSYKYYSVIAFATIWCLVWDIVLTAWQVFWITFVVLSFKLLIESFWLKITFFKASNLVL